MHALQLLDIPVLDAKAVPQGELGECMTVDLREFRRQRKQDGYGIILKMHACPPPAAARRHRPRHIRAAAAQAAQAAEGDYLQLTRGSKLKNVIYAHRLVCWALVGPPPRREWRKHVVMHLCHNKSCLHPHHLHWGTCQQNRAREQADVQRVEQELLDARARWLAARRRE